MAKQKPDDVAAIPLLPEQIPPWVEYEVGDSVYLYGKEYWVIDADGELIEAYWQDD
ncbi:MULTISPECIES: hypothetical protein [Deefgea]|uniref:Uncharacterized protein n=1 Tax=Deefgea chitinilytica TaxID=570276 RepID=A0ABS2CE61_9NEIS|nr:MULTISPECIES: hypothetical protein [Deefgea]MBM5572424.1 hypothetical protein [Deefgea chitinilytica]MBM9889660.1 hypothetical protein [Deefgea sp. CFH1-16]